jgi:putative transposase
MTDAWDDHDNESFAPRRRALDIRPGVTVRRGGKAYRIAQVIDFATVIGVDLETGRSASLPVGDLESEDQAPLETDAPSDIFGDGDWQMAERRLEAIRPLLDRGMIGRGVVRERADAMGVDVATLYRWLRRYTACGDIAALIPRKRGWKTGKSRLPAHAEAIINEVVRDYYLTVQRPSVQKTVLEVTRRCRERRIEPPGASAVRERVNRISERERLKGRGMAERARHKFTPVPGHFPNADYPLAVMQIDHTPADIILVDDNHRQPIGRPWITLAIDVYSRMVTGYHIAFDPPSETSVAMCVAHAILPKEEWLLLHGMDVDWPVWGTPRTIHVDNGADFRSESFRRACLRHGIHLEFRPVRQPRYGGHIERMLGTLLKEIHALPGTTFSSVREKEGYDAEKHATLTKSEFESWLATLICKIYHRRPHAGIGTSPIRRWESGIFGDGERPGVGLPPRPADRLTVLLDFLPGFSRTVQNFGVTIDGLRYYAFALRSWINATEPGNDDRKRQFVFKRDPRDISAVWFLDPELQQYFKIPFADQSLPSMSVWEWQTVRARLKASGVTSIDEQAILGAVTELRAKVEEASAKSKKARRQAQRQRDHNAAAGQEMANDMPKDAPRSSAPDLEDGDIDTFGDIA